MGGKFTLNGYKHNTIITAKTEFEIIACERATFVPPKAYAGEVLIVSAGLVKSY
ncbi:hypothetical protein JCM19240_6317 [Vibrio maritimus]|uniref:Uncharacterized protein n=1 Tax=Vibrio maritimus TaxID=990268 RepID=A0A090SYL7_9VIBR|nr:hypothetical protein JCM19240_6317 [Vibrio maritimus]